MPLLASRKPVQRSISQLPDEMVTEVDVDEPLAKDETEIELEKLVFGDDSGFHEGLKSYKDASTDLRGFVDGDQQQARGALEEEERLERLNDADVCTS